MRIVIVNHSDSQGGASVVSRRLLDAFLELGVDARMLVNKISPEGQQHPRIAAVSGAFTSKIAFLSEEIYNFTHNGFNRRDLFKIDSAKFGLPIWKHPWIKDADVIILNWINQGMLSLEGIEKLASSGKKILWTLHDMWPFTSICHHAGECRNYEIEGTPCCDCHYLRAPQLGCNLSACVAHKKISVYGNLSNLKFVAVSSWLAEKARKSAISSNIPVVVIPNAFPVDDYYIKPRRSRAEIGISGDEPLVVMGAARLDDSIKGLSYAIDVLNKIEERSPNKLRAVFYGGVKNPNALSSLKMNCNYLGSITEKGLIPEIYSHASAVISTSLYESLPGTLIEGQASGAWPVTFDRGGQRDIITNDSVGTIMPFGETDLFAKKLFEVTMADSCERRQRLRDTVIRKFSAQNIAQKYLEAME